MPRNQKLTRVIRGRTVQAATTEPGKLVIRFSDQSTMRVKTAGIIGMFPPGGTVKVILEDGRKVLAKRRGLKLTFTIGDRSGEALLRRLEYGPDEKTIVQQALHEAIRNAGAQLHVENGVMMLEIDPSL